MTFVGQVEEFRTPRGHRATMVVRDGTADHNNALSCLTEDEYGLADIELGNGYALDIGAHIGGVTVALALDNKQAHIIAVEALTANVEILLENLELNGVQDRVTVLHRAAAAPGAKSAVIHWGFTGTDDGGQHHRFIGNAVGYSEVGSESEEVEAVSLADLLEMAGGTFAFCKSDAEGAEYELFQGDATGVGLIRGEYHGGYDRLDALLSETHEVIRTSGYETVGGFEARPR